MNEAWSQPETEPTQHRLRVTAINRKLDAALANLTNPDKKAPQDLPGFLYLYSGKMFSRHDATFDQQVAFDRYRTRLRIATHPTDRYGTEPNQALMSLTIKAISRVWGSVFVWGPLLRLK